jgi:hypothetical protein
MYKINWNKIDGTKEFLHVLKSGKILIQTESENILNSIMELI